MSEPQEVLCYEASFAASTTGAAAAATRLHVVVRDGTCGFLHAGFQFTDAVADTKSEAHLWVLVPTVLNESLSFDVRLKLIVFLEEVACKGRQRQAAVHERLVQIQAVAEEAAAFTLQHDPRCLAKDVHTQTPVVFESLLCTTIGEEVPAVVFQSVGAFQAGIAAEQVGVDTGVFCCVPVDIGAEVEITALSDVLIGRVEYVLACFFCLRRDREYHLRIQGW